MGSDDLVRRLGGETDWNAVNTSTWETERIDLMIKRYNLPASYRRDLYNKSRELTQTPGMKFAAWRLLFPDYPLYLGAGRLKAPDIDKTTLLPALLAHPEKTPFAKAFAEFVNDFRGDAAGTPMALVLNFRGVIGGLVVHELEPASGPAVTADIVVNGPEGPCWRLSRFASLLARIDWQPERGD